jgi:aspartate kinase
MNIIVQKFGGTSVSTKENRRCVLNKILAAKADGFSPVVVVSAMGRRGESYATDTLLEILGEENSKAGRREKDQLMVCGEMISAVIMTAHLQAEGIPAVMMNGAQAGILTDENYGEARILKIHAEKIFAYLKEGFVPVVCGFQGISTEGFFTTLGRGGSDTSAAALGAAIRAEKIEIYTDVDGIFTTDPAIVKEAEILRQVNYQEVCQMAEQGAKVIHPRAVEIAMRHNIPLWVKSTFSDNQGTLISAASETEISDRIVTGIASLKNICQMSVQVKAIEAAKIFSLLAKADISVDLINILSDRSLFTVQSGCLAEALAVLKKAGYAPSYLDRCAKISIIGGGMKGVPGVMAMLAGTLAEGGIEILQTVDSYTSISALVKDEHMCRAMQLLHQKFNLAK